MIHVSLPTPLPDRDVGNAYNPLQQKTKTKKRGFILGFARLMSNNLGGLLPVLTAGVDDHRLLLSLLYAERTVDLDGIWKANNKIQGEAEVKW